MTPAAQSQLVADCLGWTRAGWDPVRWPRATWPVAPPRRAGWEVAAMPCEWPPVERRLHRWRLRYPLVPSLPSPWPGGTGLVVIV